MFDELLNKKEKWLEICKRLGYRNSKSCIQKLEALKNAKNVYEFLSNPNIGYDFHMSSEEFLKKIASMLDEKEEKKVIVSILTAKHRICAIEQIAQPYIFVQTSFRRNSEPVFLLAGMEYKLKIVLEKEWAFETPLEKQLCQIGDIVKKHYDEHKGKLLLWGMIEEYHYFHAKNKPPIIFDIRGNIKNLV